MFESSRFLRSRLECLRTGVCLATLLLLEIVTFLGAVSIAVGDDDVSSWQYVASSEVRATPRTVALTEETPDDFRTEITFEGEVQRYTQLRYGSENSRRVVVVIDQLPDRHYEFYADLDRDRVLTADEKLPGEGRVCRAMIPAEIVVEDRAEQADREVELKLGFTGKRLSVATIGFVEGYVVSLDRDDKAEAKLRVRRIDGDANGLFSDRRDRMMLDLDRDGTWNPITEQFPQMPIVKIAGRRFAVKADRLGERFSLAEITGTGMLEVAVDGLDSEVKLIGFEAMVYSNDGSAYSVKAPNQPLVVPVGKYVLGTITLTVDTGERDYWHYVFSRSGSPSEYDWQVVGKDSEVVIEAIGKPRFVLGHSEDPLRPGDTLRINPAMYTQTGLLINLCSRGRHMGSFDRERQHQTCRLQLKDNDKSIGSAQSGFA